MQIQDYIYLSILGIGVLLLVTLYIMLGKSIKTFPDSWKSSLSVSAKKFRISILFLSIYLFIILIGEIISIQLAFHGIYNSYVISINFTLFTPFLFGLLFIHTQTTWKRYSYIILYIILIAYFSIGGYYHPDSVLSNAFVPLFSSIYFLAALLHLTDLLANPKSEYFRFQLMVSVSVLIYHLLSAIITTFYWAEIITDLPSIKLMSYIHFYNIMLYYFALDLIFINEIRKFRRS